MSRTITATDTPVIGQTVEFACGATQRVHLVHKDTAWCESCHRYEHISGRVVFNQDDWTASDVHPTTDKDSGRSWYSVGNTGIIAEFDSPNGARYAIGVDENGVPVTFQNVGPGNFVQL